MRLVVISGLSGSGKSVALHMLEDLDYYCVDNIPAGLLPMFISHTVRSGESTYKLTAIGVLWTMWYHSSFWLLCSLLALGMAFVLLMLLHPLKKAMPGV